MDSEHDLFLPSSSPHGTVVLSLLSAVKVGFNDFQP